MPNEVKSPSCSIVVTLHIYDIACPLRLLYCKMYLCLRIGDLRAPQRHGKIMGVKSYI